MNKIKKSVFLINTFLKNQKKNDKINPIFLKNLNKNRNFIKKNYPICKLTGGKKRVFKKIAMNRHIFRSNQFNTQLNSWKNTKW